MTLQIGKAYRLPNGEKGLYLGAHEDGYHHIFSVDFINIPFGEPRLSEVTPWTEPREWKEEILVYESETGATETALAGQDLRYTNWKLIARSGKITVKETTHDE